MKRALVLVGVKNTGGGLPELKAVGSGVARMKRWAEAQGFDDEDIESVTDAAGAPVTASAIFDATNKFVEAGVYEQLIVYYSGHGVNNGTEYWLLSGAPTNPNEAINLRGSLSLAEALPIPHVVVISDACRTAAEGIQGLNVKGSEMFPNLGSAPAAPARVDTFYACLVGDPAHEIKDPNVAGAVHKSLYTEVFIDALKGKYVEMREAVEESNQTVDLIRPHAIGEYIGNYVTKELRDRKLWRKVSQTPHAVVTSSYKTAWLAKLDWVARRGDDEPKSAPPSLASAATVGVSRALAGDQAWGSSQPDVEGDQLLASGAALLADDYGPRHYEAGAGFKIKGDTFADGFSPFVGFEEKHAERMRTAVQTPHRAANVALKFASGSCALLPAIREFMCALTFDDGRLVDVSYEPMDTYSRGVEYQSRKQEIRTAHAAAAAAARTGVLAADPEDATDLAQYFQSLKGLDPSFAVYAAYAYGDLGRSDRVRAMDGFLDDDLGMSLFDVRLVGSRSWAERFADDGVFPSLPMMSRGWAIASAFGIPDPIGLAPARLPSLWTLYDESMYDKICEGLSKGVI